MITCQAVVKYYENWAIAYIDPQFGEYYYALVPKYWNLQRPKTPAHITVIRKGIESPDMSNWRHYENKVVDFEYEPILQRDDLYSWIDVWSIDIGSIRMYHELPPFREGFECYHITIGNFKNSSSNAAKAKE